MTMFGHQCKNKKCNKKYHNCFSCGNEEFMNDYCSERCIEQDGKILCPVCHGWGDHPDEDPDDLLDLPRCPGYIEKDSK